MTADEGERPFYEERWFKGTAAVLGLVAVVFSLIGPPKLWEVIRDALAHELPTGNTQYVLDASAAMGAPFGEDETKLTAAARTIARAVAPLENEGLALRRFGGACEERGALLVDFGADHAEEVSEAAGEQTATGESNLVNAVIAAIDDFNDDDRFPGDREFRKSIVVVTGSADACFADEGAEQIRRRITQTGIELDFTFVGVAVPEDERDRLRAVAGDLEAPVVFADTEQELGLVVDYLELQPAIADAQAIATIYNTVREALSEFVATVNAARFDAAERALKRWEGAFARTGSRFKSFGARASGADVVALHGLLGEARTMQEELREIGQTLLEAGRELETDGSENAYKNAVAEWDGVARELEDKVTEIQGAIDELIGQLPPLES